MKICAVILNYRKAKETEACIRSLIGQDIHSVVVVDNSEHEQAAAELEDMLFRLMANEVDFSTYVITPPCNLGFSGGVNLACSSHHVQSSDAVLLINNDAIASEGMVSKLASALSPAWPVAIPIVYTSHQGTQPTFWYQRYFGLMTRGWLPGAFVFPSGCCLLFRQDFLVDRNLFDEDFFMYGEDVLLGWKLSRKKGVDGPFLVKDAAVYHIGKERSGDTNLFYEYHTARGHLLLSCKTWHSKLEIPILLLCKSWSMALRAAHRSFQYKSFIPFFAFFLAWFPLSIRPYGKRQN